MTDDLRTRILHALIDSTPTEYLAPPNDLSRVVDAVIRELGLEPQVHYDPDCKFFRYVTDWIDPQTNRRVELP